MGLGFHTQKSNPDFFRVWMYDRKTSKNSFYEYIFQFYESQKSIFFYFFSIFKSTMVNTLKPKLEPSDSTPGGAERSPLMKNTPNRKIPLTYVKMKKIDF